MKYELLVTVGEAGKEYVTVKDVKEVNGTEKYFTVFGQKGEVLLTVPREKLVYCLQVD